MHSDTLTILYSVLNECAGFVRAAFKLWKLTANKAMITTKVLSFEIGKRQFEFYGY